MTSPWPASGVHAPADADAARKAAIKAAATGKRSLENKLRCMQQPETPERLELNLRLT